MFQPNAIRRTFASGFQGRPGSASQWMDQLSGKQNAYIKRILAASKRVTYVIVSGHDPRAGRIRAGPRNHKIEVAELNRR